jgi:hypothetical protein
VLDIDLRKLSLDDRDVPVVHDVRLSVVWKTDRPLWVDKTHSPPSQPPFVIAAVERPLLPE